MINSTLIKIFTLTAFRIKFWNFKRQTHFYFAALSIKKNLFLENEFRNKCDVDQDFSLFEMEDQNDLLVPSQVGDIHEMFQDHLILVRMTMKEVV